MSGYWPTPLAFKNSPLVAEGMNNAEKIVFSRTLKQADWQNTMLIQDNVMEQIKGMKLTPGRDMTVLGSGSIVTQFAQHGLIDEYQLMVEPVVLGAGTPILKGLQQRLDLQLASTRQFKNGASCLFMKPLHRDSLVPNC